MPSSGPSMWRTRGGRRLRGAALAAWALAFAGAEVPGEAWARRGPAGAEARGEASAERPMGSLAKLVWTDLEGGRWEGEGRRFRCPGTWQGRPCWLKSGHGEVDFPAALRESCNLAFLAWAQQSLDRWTRESGGSAARQKLEAAFAPFLGDRLPPGDLPPPLGTFWVGDGDLLRTSPVAFLQWLADPRREDLRLRCGRLLAAGGGWVKSGTAAVPGREGSTAAWAAGEAAGGLLAVYLPRGRGKIEGLARFRELAAPPPAPEQPTAPAWEGDPEAQTLLEEALDSALRSTLAFGPWPSGPWTVRLHDDAGGFAAATGAPPFRAAAWVGGTLHLRPWVQLRRRDLGALLRHEVVHRRLTGAGLAPWEEEARCLWAEAHPAPPAAWPEAPDAATRRRLDALLTRGTPTGQARAYRDLRAWVRGQAPAPGDPP